MSDLNTEHGRIPDDVLPIFALDADLFELVIDAAAAHALAADKSLTVMGVRVTDGDLYLVTCGCRRCALLLGTISILPDTIAVELAANDVDPRSLQRYACPESRSVWLCDGILPWTP